jgi:hypothetical protein
MLAVGFTRLLNKTRLYLSKHGTRPPISVSVVRRALRERLDDRNRNSSHVGMTRTLSPNHPSAPSTLPSRTQMLMGIHELPGNGEEWQSLRRAEPDNMQVVPACPEHESLAKVSVYLSLLPCARTLFFARPTSLSDHHSLALPSLSTLSVTLHSCCRFFACAESVAAGCHLDDPPQSRQASICCR